LRQQGYYLNENPVRDTAISPTAPQPRETYVSTTVTYYVKTRDEQTAQAMAKLEDAMPEMLTVN